MNSTPNPKATEPADVECADEQLAHVTEQPSKPDHGAARHPSAVPAAGHRVVGQRYLASSACCWQRASLSLLSFRSRPMAVRPSSGGRRSSF